MFIVKTKDSPNSFRKIIAKRRSEWGGVKIAARIVVPPDLQWWYWQEFGTAAGGKTGDLDSRGGASGRTYEIVPTGPGYPLRWPDGAGGEVVSWKVKAHPGVSARHFVTSTLKNNISLAALKIVAAMQGNQWSVDAVRQALLEDVMPTVKSNIVQMISSTGVTGTRPDGKLEGQSAPDDFNQRAQIRNSGS